MCSEYRHQVVNCPKQNDKINVEGNTVDSDQEHVLMADMLKKYNKLEDNTWLFDSGTTCHLMNDPMYDIIKINKTAIIGDGNGLKITKQGKLHMIVEQNDGSTCNLTFDVKVTTEVSHQLLSLTMLMQEGWKVITVWRNYPIKSTILWFFQLEQLKP